LQRDPRRGTGSFVGEIIPFRRIKTIVVDRLAERFAFIEKSPPKERELRLGKPEGRIAGREGVLGGLDQLKFVHRARRHAKLHLFRMWKLFGQLKDEPAQTVYRPVAERIKEARAIMRL
jgi:hypothetical protein